MNHNELNTLINAIPTTGIKITHKIARHIEDYGVATFHNGSCAAFTPIGDKALSLQTTSTLTALRAFLSAQSCSAWLAEAREILGSDMPRIPSNPKPYPKTGYLAFGDSAVETLGSVAKWEIDATALAFPAVPTVVEALRKSASKAKRTGDKAKQSKADRTAANAPKSAPQAS